MSGQEPRDLGAMIVQQGYKLLFEMLDQMRLDRPNEEICWVYVRLPTHPDSCSKNGSLCSF